MKKVMAGQPGTAHASLVEDGGANVSEAIIDENMSLEEVDDLFGGPVNSAMETALDLPQPQAGPSMALLQRLDDLRRSGCCQGIAWSRQGTIASVAKDGQAIEIHFLRVDPKNGTWDLSKSTTCTAITSPLVGGPIVHLGWAATSHTELAVIDAVGRVYMLTFAGPVNRPVPVRKWDADPVDDLNAVVGCYWLPQLSQGRQFHAVLGPAVWKGTDYAYEHSLTPASGPFHPNPAKSALLCVTAKGFLRLYFSQSNNKIEDTAVEVESVQSSEHIVTHAAICSHKGYLVIALATASKQLKLVRVVINWGMSTTEKNIPPGSIPLNPSFHVTQLAVSSGVQPGPGDSVLPHNAHAALLSHLELLPSVMHPPNQSTAPPMMLTVRSHVPAGGPPSSHEPLTIIHRWHQVQDQWQTIHPAFAQLSGGNDSSQTAEVTRLQKLDMIVIRKVVVAVQVMLHGHVVAFACSDGTVHYRDRRTWEQIFHQLDLDRLMSPHQAGFSFAEHATCLQVAFSPTNCSLAQICEDGKVKWNGMRYTMAMPLFGSALKQQGSQEYAAIRAALGIAVSGSTSQSINYDDVLCMARTFSDRPDFATEWVRDILTIHSVRLDYTDEAEQQLFRNAYLHFALSILNHLGFHGECQPRSFSSKLAMLVLNLRSVLMIVAVVTNMSRGKGQLNLFDEPEVLSTLVASVAWVQVLLAWIADGLFVLLRDATIMDMAADPQRFSELATHLRDKGNVALHLVLCSSTRLFLMSVCRRVADLDVISRRAIDFYASKALERKDSAQPVPPLRAAYRNLQHCCANGLVKPAEFEKLLQQLGADIRTAYQTAFPTQGNNNNNNNSNNSAKVPAGNNVPNDPAAKAKAGLELDLLLGGTVPAIFQPVLKTFLNEHLINFRGRSDPAKIYFCNYDVLEADEAPGVLEQRRQSGKRVDAFKRVLIPVSQWWEGAGEGRLSLRRCVRCAAVMEDVYGQRPGINFVVSQQRKCNCNGTWAILPRGQLTN